MQWEKGKGNGLDYFLTMTANSEWDEITSSLFRDANRTLFQRAIDRPDLVARVFKMKLDAMLEDVFEKQILGKVAAYAWTLEYQVQYAARRLIDFNFHLHLFFLVKHLGIIIFSSETRTAACPSSPYHGRNI
jgi:hypothetical protein